MVDEGTRVAMLDVNAIGGDGSEHGDMPNEPLKPSNAPPWRLDTPTPIDAGVGRTGGADDLVLRRGVASGAAPWRLAADGTILEPGVLVSATGRARHDMIGAVWTTLVSEVDRERADTAWEDARRARGICEITCALQHMHGAPVEVALRLVPSLGLDGRVLEWLGAVRIGAGAPRADFRDEPALPAPSALAQLDAVFALSSDTLLLYDASGALRRASAAARALLGELGEERSARSLHDGTGSGRRGDVYDRLRRDEQWPLWRVLRGENLSRDECVEIVLGQPQGHEMVFAVSGMPVRETDGRIVGALLSIRDTTERRRLEYRSQGAVRGLLAMAEALVLASSDADTDTVTPAAPVTRGAGPERQLAEVVRDVMECERAGVVAFTTEGGVTAPHPLMVVADTPEHERDWEALWRDPSAARALLTAETLARLDADEVLLHRSLVPESQPEACDTGERVLLLPMRVGDQMLGLLTLERSPSAPDYSLEDIAVGGALARLSGLVMERQRLLRQREEAHASELALAEATRRMDEFLSIASHELKTPLTSMKATLQVAARRLRRSADSEGGEPASPDAQTDAVVELLQRIDVQTTRLARLVADLLDTSRLRVEVLPLRPAPCDLLTITRDELEALRLTWPERIILLDAHGAPGRVPLYADAQRVGQAITNYVVNALKYAPPDQPVVVRVMVEGATARLSVSDSGPGLPPNECEHVWDRFYRVRGIESQHSSQVGLGLGLHITRSIVERHGGTVGVESTPGAGATFWLTLPLAR